MSIKDPSLAHGSEDQPTDHPAAVPPEKMADETAASPASPPPPPPPPSWLNHIPDMSALSADDLLVQAQPAPAAPMRLRFGQYTLLEIIGRGGMGVVYKAEQQTPRRMVALKLVLAERATKESLKRFQREIEILGRLKHPNITQIYDAGTIDGVSGPQAYFSMELVEGLPINRYVMERGPATHDIVRLMITICEAIDYAHGQGIIHRDLKPGNILVSHERGGGEMRDGGGIPKIMDFGIARVLDQDPNTTLHTSTGQFMGTLAYISPEQASGSGAKVDARSDIYALGVLLFELLTGHLPYRVHDVEMPNALRIILEDDPSRLTSFNRELKGDLEVIVGKALEKEPSRRYASARAMAEDLRRYLSHDPIAAKLPTLTYRALKFVRRHKAMVIGTLSVFLVLVIGLISTYMQFRRANFEAHEAKLRWAEGLTDSGNLHLASGHFKEAKETFEKSRALFNSVREDEFPAEMGLWAAERAQGEPAMELALPDLAPDNPVTAIALLADGMTAVLGQKDGTITMRSLPTNQILTRLTGTTQPIRQFFLTADQRQVWGTDNEGGIYRWSITGGGTGGPDFTLPNPQKKNRLLAVAPDGRQLVLSNGEQLLLGENQTFTMRRLENVGKGFSKACYSPDGHWLAGVDQSAGGGHFALWDAPQGTKISTWQHGTGANHFAFLRDSQALVTSGNDGTVRQWHLPEGTFQQMGSLNSMELLPSLQNDLVVNVAASQAFELLEPSTATIQRHFAEDSHVNLLARSMGSPVVLSGDHNNHFQVWNLEDLGVRNFFPPPTASPTELQPQRTLVLTVSPDERLVFTGSNEGGVTVWDLASRRPLWSLTETGEAVVNLIGSEDNHYLWVIRNDNHLECWNLETGKAETPTSPMPSNVGAMDCSRNGLLATTSIEKKGSPSIQLRNMSPPPPLASSPPATHSPIANTTGREIQVVDGKPAILKFSPNGALLAVGTEDGQLILFDTPTAKEISRWQVFKRSFEKMAFCGKEPAMILCASPEGALATVDLHSRTPEAITTIGPIGGGKSQLLQNIDSDTTTRWLLIADMSNGVSIWDRKNNRELRRLTDRKAGAATAVWLKQTNSILLVGETQALQLLDIDRPQRLRELAPKLGNPIVLGQWYVEQGLDDWAVAVWEKARMEGKEVPVMDLAFAYWRQGNRVKAAGILDAIPAAKESIYLRLCRKAVQETTRP